MGTSRYLTAVILAAGKSSRMGEFKPLLTIGGIAAVKRLISSIRESGVDNIVVVTGHNRSALESELDSLITTGQLITELNPDYEHGMFTSIQVGLKKAFIQAERVPDAVLLFPVDIPLISSEIIKSLISKSEEKPDRFIVPCFEGKKGHPLIIPGDYIQGILDHDGTNGLKGAISKYDDRLIRLETGKEEVVLDMDNPEDYIEIQRYFELSKDNKDAGSANLLKESGFSGRLFLIRHGSTEQHKEKIFMGQVDVPLSDKGRNEVRTVAETLIDADPKTNIIYTSPLIRAKESAEIIRDRFFMDGIKKRIEEKSRFKEIALGDWDGRFISEIKEKFPGEYDKRGRSFLTYKRDPDGENYYDLRYRVLKELKVLLSGVDHCEDIIIVTHKGVINVIRENAFGLEPEEAANYDPPRGSVTLIEPALLT